MSALTGKTMVVIGGSRGVGRRIVEAGVRNGPRVLAAARQEAPLRRLAEEVSGAKVLALDATDEAAPMKVFDALAPDIVVVSAGAFPPAAPLHEQSWPEFAVNWETDVKIAFHFCKAALTRPLPAGASVILVSSGAALVGSPISGGYPAPNALSCSSRTTPRRNWIGSGSACASWRSRPGSCPTPSSEGMPSMAIRGILAYPQPTSFRAWLRLRVRPTSRTQSSSLLPTRINSRVRPLSSQGPASKPRSHDKAIEDDRRRSNVGPDDSGEDIAPSARGAERGADGVDAPS